MSVLPARCADAVACMPTLASARQAILARRCATSANADPDSGPPQRLRDTSSGERWDPANRRCRQRTSESRHPGQGRVSTVRLRHARSSRAGRMLTRLRLARHSLRTRTQECGVTAAFTKPESCHALAGVGRGSSSRPAESRCSSLRSARPEDEERRGQDGVERSRVLDQGCSGRLRAITARRAIRQPLGVLRTRSS
jgi:hypothetical protein